jgi:TolA-binding protein
VAIQVLKQLTTDTDPRIALLAEAQLWRTQQVSVSLQGLKQWKGQISRLPTALRAGPYFLLAGGLNRHQHHEQAIVSWMRIPINYPQHYQLAAESLLASAKKLNQLQREPQARNLYQEIVTRYASTVAAGQAQRWLDQGQPQSQPQPKE